MKKKRLLLVATVLLAVGVCALLCRKDASEPTASVARAASPAVSGASLVATATAPVAPPAESFCLPSNQTATVRGTKPYVLKSEVKFQKSLRLAAESLGARTVGVRSPKELLIEADAAACSRLRADGRFSEVAECLPSDKVQDRLLAALKAGAKEVEASVVSLAADDRQRLVACIESDGGEILTGCLNDGCLIRARLTRELVATLVARGDVRWLETFVRPQLTNYLAVNPQAMNVRPVWNVHSLTGEAQKVSTSDSGIDTGDTKTMHRDLRDRILDIKIVEGCDTTDRNGHGTHTAGSIVGTGVESEESETGPIRGSAYGAKLYAWFCATGGGRGIYLPSSCPELFRGLNEKGVIDWPDAYIHSASWGSDAFGEYTTTCAQFDSYLWLHPDFLPVVSAGNAGEYGLGTIGSPAAAKNVLAVGATLNVNAADPDDGRPAKTTYFSSRGPCADGRTKPDIAAPGQDIWSTLSTKCENYRAGKFYQSMSGTSMSCPLTAGSVALVRQWLCQREEYQEKKPSAAMMKAVITGGARGAAVPNNEQGWGRVDLEETLFPSNRAVRLEDYIPFEEGGESYFIVETTNAAPLDVQLVWIDFPGDNSHQYSPKLVNDIDLIVEPLDGADGSIYYGNGGDEPDTLNNLESVHIAEAQPNRYLITVYCSTILHDSSEGGAAALYIRGAFDPTKKLEEETEGNVRIVGSTRFFGSLDSAIRAAQPNDTIEVLSSTRLRSRRTFGFDCTIRATNDVPAASAVTFSSKAELVVGNGATLALSNICFQKNDQRTVDVQSEGVLNIASGTDISEVRVADKEGLYVSGLTTKPLLVDAPFAKTNGAYFGRCADEASGANAIYLLNKYDEESAGDCEGTRLRWGHHPTVPLEAASVCFKPESGGETLGYRSLSVLFKYNPSAAGAISFVRNSTLTNLVSVSGNLFLYGERDGLAMTPGSSARFTVGAGGSLVISNLTVSGYTGPRLFRVQGGDMTLCDGAVLEDLHRNGEAIDYSDGPDVYTPDAGGVTIVESGTFTMLSGATIRDCSVASDGSFYAYGGGIYVYGGTVNLFGGTITDCRADDHGAGVYVDMSYDDDGFANLKGDLRIAGNWREGTAGLLADNLCIFGNSVDEEDKINHPVVGALTEDAKIGINYDSQDNAAGETIATVDPVLTDDEAALSAAAFSNDVYGRLRPEVGDDGEDGRVILWSTKTEGEVDPDEAGAMTIYGEGTVTNYYWYVEDAFLALTNDATIVVLTNGVQYSDITVRHNVVLRSADGESYRLEREGDCSITIPANVSLAVTNVVCDGLGYELYRPFFSVEGGALTLGDRTIVTNVYAATYALTTQTATVVPSAAAVWVKNGGTVTMEEGALITYCVNQYDGYFEGVYKDADASQAGGIVLMGGTAYLRGGVIENCYAWKGGAVFVGNDSVAYVSDAFRATDNGCWKQSPDYPGPRASNITYDGNGLLGLAEPFTGSVGVSVGWNVTKDNPWNVPASTNVFGFVNSNSPVDTLVESAKKFYKDANTSAYGVIATNDTVAILVWSTAIQVDEQTGERYYEDEDGKRYGAVEAGEPPEPPPVVITYVDPPKMVTNEFVYSGLECVAISNVAGAAYVLTDNIATNVGTYAAVAHLTNTTLFAWTDKTTADKTYEWRILPQPVVTNEVPVAVLGLVYNGHAQTGVVEGVNYTLTDNVATDAGDYTATATLTNGVWKGGSDLPTNIAWKIAKATYDMSKVVFTNETYIADGNPHSILVSGTVPSGVTVTYEGNGQTEVGVYTVTAKFAGDAKNYDTIDDKTATLTIIENPTPPEPPVEPVTTNYPSAIAFQSISRLSETEWRLVVTNRVEWCRYALTYTDDLTKGFTTTSEWTQATQAGPWTNDVETTGGQYFWKALGTWGIVPKEKE